MSDNGMLINFDLGDTSVKSKPAFSGGSWKDRLTAKKAAAYRQQKAAQSAAGGVNLGKGSVQSATTESRQARPVVAPDVPRPAKKQRLDEEGGINANGRLREQRIGASGSLSGR